MKQRLLLSLLMLFVSVGLVKAAIYITVPKGTGTVKISLSSASFTFSDKSVPYWTLDGTEKVPDNMLATGKFSSKEVTYTVTMDDKEHVAAIKEGLDNSVNWGDITLKIDGKVTEFSSDGGDLSKKKIVAIEFVNNGELTKLRLDSESNKTGTAYFPNLTSLSCAGNKLNRIPVKPENMSAANYNVGEQTPTEGEVIAISDDAKSFALSADAFSKVFATGTVTKGTDLSIVKLVDDKGTAVPYDYDDVESIYHLRDSKGVYVDAGTYKANIKVSADNDFYPNVVICNVPLQVEATTFDLTFTYDEEPGNGFKIQVNGVEKTAPITGLKKGDVITLTPIPNESAGYEFTGTFESNGGVSAPKLNGNGYDFTVVGNIDPEIKATFKLKDGVKVTWNTETTDGKITIRQNGKVLTGNEAALTVGSEIHIYVKANAGKSIADVKMGSTTILSEDENDAPDVFDAKVKVPAEGANITVEFVAMTQQLTIKHPNGPASNTITIKDATGKTYGSQINDDTNSDIIADIPVGTRLTIIFPVQDKDGKYVGSVLVNGKTIPTEMTADGTYVIKDFEMKEAVTMTVNVTILKKIDVSLDKDVTYTYNGEAQAVIYTATDNLSDIEVYYGKIDDPVSAYKKDGKFTDAGTYKVYFKRAVNKTYAELNTSDNPKSYTIHKAPLVVNEVPKVSVDATTKKYQITGGKIGYMNGNTFKEVTGLGKFVVLDDRGNVVEDDQDEAVVAVRYQFNKTEYANYDISTWKDVRVEVEGKDAEMIKVSVFDNDYSSLLVLKNGGAVIENGSSVPVGSTITFELTDKINNDNVVYTVTLTDGEGKQQDLGNLWAAPNNGNLAIDENLVKDYSQLVFKLEVKDNRQEIKLAKASEELLKQGGDEKNPIIVYDGKAHAFDASKLSWVDTNGKAIADKTIESINKLVKKTYTINGEVLTEAPVDAGTYTVTLSYDKLENFTVKPIQATLTIHKAEFTSDLVPTPDASQVALGQKLDKSNLSGQATIEGAYQWDEEKPASEITVDADKTYKVKFVPTKNYKEAQLKESVSVPVTNNPVITFNPNPEGGKVTVVNKNDPNDIYESGDEVFAGTELVITATPDTDFELASLIANGAGVSNPYTVKFDKTTIEIEASFRVKVLPGNFKVTIPDGGVRGATISGGGEFVVAAGGSLSFTVSTLAADANKVSVTASNGTVTKGSNGRYTVSNIQAKTTVRVSLSNPTPLKVEVQKSYLNDKKYHVGSVEIAEGESTTYYYGDVITVVAYPESGVKFEKWSDGSKEQVHEIELKGDMKVTATFSGIPTGIEDIESAAITTGKGFIMVKNVANAKVTVVSISGRLQAQEEVSGDTRIDVPQGIYVVVLESGSDVKRVKVIVK